MYSCTLKSVTKICKYAKCYSHNYFMINQATCLPLRQEILQDEKEFINTGGLSKDTFVETNTHTGSKCRCHYTPFSWCKYKRAAAKKKSI